jgi:hypothetical protein
VILVFPGEATEKERNKGVFIRSTNAMPQHGVSVFQDFIAGSPFSKPEVVVVFSYFLSEQCGILLF